MPARHTEQKRNVFRRMHVAAIKKLVDGGLTLAGDSKIRQFSEQWRIGYEIGQKHLAEEIRVILGAPPKGYSDIEPTLKTKAKNRYLDWREMQAKGEWKSLPEAEQKIWESYVENHTPFEEIREKELAREKDFEIGDRVVLVNDITYIGYFYPTGSAGEIISTEYNEIREKMMFKVRFDSEKLDRLNTFANEIKKEK